MCKPHYLASFWIAVILLISSFWFKNAVFLGIFFLIVNQFEVVRKNQEILNNKLDLFNSNLVVVNRNLIKAAMKMENKDV